MIKRWLLPLILVLTFLMGCGASASQSEEIIHNENKEIKEEVTLESEDLKEEEPAEQQADTDIKVTEEDEQDIQPDQDKKSNTHVSGDMTIHFIDVGQGDGILIETSAGNILVDAGNWNGRAVIDYLNQVGIRHLDLMIATHPDADHIGQMPLILEALTVDEVWMNGVESTSKTFENTIDLILAKDIVYYEPEAGDGVDFGDVMIDVLGPLNRTNDPNQDSIVTQVTHGDVSILLTGDAGIKEEAALVSHYGKGLESDILKLGHHGSNTSSSQNFLDTVNPDIAIISASENNSYGHPHDEVMNRLINRSVDVYQTSQHGSIVFESDGEDLRIVKAKSAPTKPVIDSSQQHNTVEETSDGGEKETSNDDLTESKPIKSESTVTVNDGCVNLNTASKEDLMTIIHIADVRADLIIEKRPFQSVDQLTRIKGIAAGRLKDIKAENKACVR